MARLTNIITQLSLWLTPSSRYQSITRGAQQYTAKKGQNKTGDYSGPFLKSTRHQYLRTYAKDSTHFCSTSAHG